MKVFILLSVVTVALARIPCGENQHYESCGTACPLTCENYHNPPKFCILICKSGCHCDEGYVKTTDGSCVKPENCPAKGNSVCGANQRFTYCSTACPLTCENYDNPPKFCNEMCVFGCKCEDGYVQTRDARCVRPEDCSSIVPQTGRTCLEKPHGSMCNAYFPMWYYDVQSGTCKEFVYGGCLGNSNRYVTEKECLDNCRNVKAKQSSSDVCSLPAEEGVCDAYMPRYFFDETRGECRRFIYGGCGGNGNNFRTIEECEKTCDLKMKQSSSGVCSLPSEVGLCDALIPRFYFDETRGECRRFIYGGCEGNGNNFKTIEDCQRTCA